jgi:hypothetical protein
MTLGLEETLAQTGGGVGGRLEGGTGGRGSLETAIPACKYGRARIPFSIGTTVSGCVY